MAEAFQLEVATPERLIVEERVTEAQIPERELAPGVEWKIVALLVLGGL